MSSPAEPTKAPRLPLPGPFLDHPAVAKVVDWYRARDLAPMNVHHTLAYCPQLMGPLNALTMALMNESALSGPDRELVILRTGVVAHGEYEVFHHNVIGRLAGLNDAQVEGVVDWRTAADAYSPAQRALLAYIDESLSLGGVSDAVFAEVAAHYSRTQIVEATLLSGVYAMLSQATRSLEIPFDPPLSQEKVAHFKSRIAAMGE